MNNKWLKCHWNIEYFSLMYSKRFKLKRIFFSNFFFRHTSIITFVSQWRRSISSSIPTARNCWRKWSLIWGGSWCRWWRLLWRDFLHRCHMTPGLRIKQLADNCREQSQSKSITVSSVFLYRDVTFDARKEALSSCESHPRDTIKSLLQNLLNWNSDG